MLTRNMSGDPSKSNSLTPNQNPMSSSFPLTTKGNATGISVEKLDKSMSAKSQKTAKSLGQSVITELQTSYVTSDSLSRATKKSLSQKQDSEKDDGPKNAV